MTTDPSTVRVDLHAAAQRAAAHSAGPRSRIAIALALAVATLGLGEMLGWTFPSGSLLLLLVLPLLIASTALGATAGAVTLVTGLLGAAVVELLQGHPLLAAPIDAARLATYACVGGMTILGASALRHSVRHASTPGDRRPGRLVEPLTPRETEVLGLAASGLTNAEIASRLRVSGNTVKSHLAHAYGKLGARNRAEATVAALHSGSIPADVVLARAPEIAHAAVLSRHPSAGTSARSADPHRTARIQDADSSWAGRAPVLPEVR